MRFFEIVTESEDSLEKFVIVLKNFIGRAASKKAPVRLNWNALNRILTTNGAEITADYETFKAMYDGSPILQSLVKNFNADGIDLNVPGAPDAEKESPNAGKDSEAAIDKIASSAAQKQVAQNQQTPQV